MPKSSSQITSDKANEFNLTCNKRSLRDALPARASTNIECDSVGQWYYSGSTCTPGRSILLVSSLCCVNQIRLYIHPFPGSWTDSEYSPAYQTLSKPALHEAKEVLTFANLSIQGKRPLVLLTSQVKEPSSITMHWTSVDRNSRWKLFLE